MASSWIKKKLIEQTANEVKEKNRRSSLEDAPFGRFNKEGTRNINFNDLTNGAFRNNENDIKWQDGIRINNLDPAYLQDLANEIADIYGFGNLTVKPVEDMENSSIALDTQTITYGPHWLMRQGNMYGRDLLIQILAHEVGHQVVMNTGLHDSVTYYEHEACADYIAGLTARLCKLDSKAAITAHLNKPLLTDNRHPGKEVRLEAFNRGFSRIDRGSEASGLRAFEDFSNYDCEGIYRQPDVLKQILLEDIINPLRNGEIKKK